MVAAQARVFGQAILQRQRAALDLVVGPAPLRPGDRLGQQETAQPAVQRLQVEPRVRAEADFLVTVVGPDLQQVLFLAQHQARNLDAQAQQALVGAVTLDPAELDEAQRAGAGAPVGGQRCQAEQAEMLRRQVGPGVRWLLLGFFCGRLGVAIDHRASSGRPRSRAGFQTLSAPGVISVAPQPAFSALPLRRMKRLSASTSCRASGRFGSL
ncbi:Uncharacterised protein [Pseudomonas aeruginosa]|nr:Uncharacterised protein [Pseudomonas aeruginosa]